MAVRRILIAAAGEGDAQQLASRLAGLGYEVAATAASAEEIVSRSMELAPDVILMDLELHGGPNGQRRLLPIPTVFMTDDASENGLRQRGITSWDAHVVKPFTDRELRANLELVLCRHNVTSEARDLADRFFAVSIDMLCCLDFNGYFKRLNPAWERTLGFTIKELMSRPFIEFVHPDDRERTLAQNKEVRSGGRAVMFENRYLCKDGSFRWFLWNAAPDAPERAIYSVARDITARKQAEDEKERLVGELRAALAEVKVLQEILPICSYCRKIRDDENYWQTVESYISHHTNSRFSHGICPHCLETRVAPQIAEWESE